MKKPSRIIQGAMLISLSAIAPLFLVTEVKAGVVERMIVLEDLALIEALIYIGNTGGVGSDATHPSALYRLTDAKLKNDNGLVGAMDELEIELSGLRQSVFNLIPEDNDFQILQDESQAGYGVTFTDRLDILINRMIQIRVLLNSCGINNSRLEYVIAVTESLLSNLIEIRVYFGSNLS